MAIENHFGDDDTHEQINGVSDKPMTKKEFTAMRPACALLFVASAPCGWAPPVCLRQKAAHACWTPLDLQVAVG